MRLEQTTPSVDLSSPEDTGVPIATSSAIVVGAGGHGRELADIIGALSEVDATIKLLGLVDDGEVDRLALARAGFRFLGDSGSAADRDVALYLGLGHPRVRRQVAKRLNAVTRRHNRSTSAVPVVGEAAPRWGGPIHHPSAQLGSGSRLGVGSVLAQGAIITTNVLIGNHTHIGVGSTISHDCQLGDFVTICPGVTITGTVTIESDAFVGAGATILPGVSVGRGAVIGAGATVISDIAPKVTAAGVPARTL